VRNGSLQLEVNGYGPIPGMHALLLRGNGRNNYANLTRGNAMRSTILALACGLGLVAASAALADQPQQPMAQPVSAVSTTPNPNPVICHTFIHEGVVLRARECHTQQEWDTIRFRNQEAIREFQDSSLTSTLK
jgi:hypothetical protein